MPSKNQ
jgi:hypothetical protein